MNNQTLDAKTIADINNYDSQQRYQYFVKTAVKSKQIWILNDNDGCVMLTTDDEDCVPVWPNEQFALKWATGQWQDCKAMSISLDKWLKDWTPGLLDDDLSIVVFPQAPDSLNGQSDNNIVMFADELDYELRQKNRRK